MTAISNRAKKNGMNGSAELLHKTVESALQAYFKKLDGISVTNVYDMVIKEIEAPMLKTVLTLVEGNQTRAAEVLGLSRGTLRKKLRLYDLIDAELIR